jgi:hypothetical protein
LLALLTHIRQWPTGITVNVVGLERQGLRALAVLVPPLELFPFASSAPMGAIALRCRPRCSRGAVWLVVSLVF